MEIQPPRGGAILTTVFICRSFAFCMMKRLSPQVEVKSWKTKENGISHIQEYGSHSSYEGNHGSFFRKFSSEVEKCIMWSSIQVLPNQVSKKSFYTLEDIDLREYHAKVHKNRNIKANLHTGYLRKVAKKRGTQISS